MSKYSNSKNSSSGHVTCTNIVPTLWASRQYIVLHCDPHPRVWSIPVKPVLDKSKLVPGKQALEIYQSLRYVHPKNNYLFTHFHFLPNNLTGSQAVCRLATRAPHRRIPIYLFLMTRLIIVQTVSRLGKLYHYF